MSPEKSTFRSLINTAAVALWATAALLLLPAVALAGTIKLGAILAVTGPASFLGAPEARTLEMLVAETNARGGINGDKIELIIKDSGGSPEKAISFARQLIEEERVFAIIGPSTSGETLKIKKICEQGRTILLSCAAAEVIVNPVGRYVFKVAPNDRHAAGKIFQTMQALGISQIAVLSGNTGFGKAGKAQLAKLAPTYGITIRASEVYDKKATDLSAVIAKLRADQEIQAVVNWSIVPAQSILAKNMRQAGWQVPLFQSSGFGSIKYVQAAGAAAEGIIFPASRLLVAEELAADHPQKATLLRYKKSYEAKFKEEASTFGGHTYDAFLLFSEALKQAGPNREKVRTELENLQGFAGTAGTFNFSPSDHNGLGEDSFAVLTVKDGAFTFYNASPAAP